MADLFFPNLVSSQDEIYAPYTRLECFYYCSGMVVGVVKAISTKPVLMAISFGILTNVMFNSAASAIVGYFVKCGPDRLSSTFKSKSNDQNSPKVDESACGQRSDRCWRIWFHSTCSRTLAVISFKCCQ